MPPLFVTPPFSPWRPGDAFNQEKEVKYKRKRKRGEKTKRKNKEVNKSKEKERKTCGSNFSCFYKFGTSYCYLVCWSL